MARPDAPITIKPGDKIPPMRPLDPEHGHVVSRQMLSFEPPLLDPPPPAPLRTRTLKTLRELQEQAEADPEGAVDVGELVRVLRVLVDRVL